MALALLALPAICCAAFDVDSLLAGLARPVPAVTPFVEARFSRLLERPLVARGTLEYRGPNELARTVTAPFAESTRISGDTVIIERTGQKARRFSLRRVPQLRGLLGGFGAVLSGDRSVLEHDFDIQLSGQPDRWEMRLTSKSPRVAHYLRNIVIQGANGDPRCISVVEPDDDASIMLVGAAAAQALPESLQRAWLEGYCAHPGS